MIKWNVIKISYVVRLYKLARTYFIKGGQTKQSLIFFPTCDTSLQFLRHDELQIWGAEDCGSADDQSQWFRNFKLSSNHSVNRTQLQTQHALANRSGIFLLRFGATEDKPASLMRNWSAETKVLLQSLARTRLPHVPKISALAPARLSRDPLGLVPPPLRSGGFQNPPSFLGDDIFFYFY